MRRLGVLTCSVKDEDDDDDDEDDDDDDDDDDDTTKMTPAFTAMTAASMTCTLIQYAIVKSTSRTELCESTALIVVVVWMLVHASVSYFLTLVLFWASLCLV